MRQGAGDNLNHAPGWIPSMRPPNTLAPGVDLKAAIGVRDGENANEEEKVGVGQGAPADEVQQQQQNVAAPISPETQVHQPQTQVPPTPEVEVQPE